MSDYKQRGDATTVGQKHEQYSPSNWTITEPIEGLRADIDILAATYRGTRCSWTTSPASTSSCGELEAQSRAQRRRGRGARMTMGPSSEAMSSAA